MEKRCLFGQNTQRQQALSEMLTLKLEPIIRRLGPDDAFAFKAIRLEALRTAPELLRSTFELEDKFSLDWFAGRLVNAHVLGAICNEQLVGTAGFAIQQGQPNLHKGSLWGMFVHPSVRNLGIGRLLLNAILDVARGRVEIIQLSVVKDNWPAKKLYESSGFREFGVEHKASKYGDTYYDEALMAFDFSRQSDVA